MSSLLAEFQRATNVEPSGPADQLTYTELVMVYVGYGVLLAFGYLREYVNRLFGNTPFVPKKGYAPLLDSFTYFYTRYLYQRISDAWNRPITDCPGAHLTLLERRSRDHNASYELTGRTRRALNLGSYNYLGFAEASGPVLEDVVASLHTFGVSACSSLADAGYMSVHAQLERCVAAFVGKPEALCYSMGYATNSTTLPALIGRGGLLVSDMNNHASLVVGCRTSGATVRTFLHNDPEDLERVVRDAIVNGQPRTHRPWTKIIILVEGIYSMEGEVLRLPEIVEVKKRYKCYLYVDEAHSIGALGRTGRGVAEYWGVPPSDIDVFMGTFTKSFGSVGGYVAGSAALIAQLRHTALSTRYATVMAPGCARQALSALEQILTDAGRVRIKRLHDNSNHFRERLSALGFQVYGDPDSPVVPMMLFFPGKISAFSRLCLERNIAVVVVGLPATPLLLSRCRFCISAAHTREDLDKAIDAISEVGDMIDIKYCKRGQVWRRPLPFDYVAGTKLDKSASTARAEATVSVTGAAERIADGKRAAAH
mmetsp:Transcript_10695/g.25832  ORF Transcript_10695/g.25832 Transcript_10695/m.25832 type:complete len:539 (-) Transcript_10695:114-1730(-)|eukprot:CAMPEP_0198338408 /NCGR_PEP_ID=MMETSP1450-20131203/34416_1 /TAXON_ID=753684 ORGANISM="Madagascaria erythrocladiodes, Strain CCMP3234" /NCGR_SAMPLE_ID=MMETSP1450 /ASSEMBLY_ACC=CAM_ASM_001115 /LENGTH=538 /DNA_ID=CAMNT_0044043281 /DNA_START=88 /DNA_END=1704 /DNA_ORIENTATION=+